MDLHKMFSGDLVAEPILGFESVTNKLMNVVMTFENLTPGLVMFRNHHSGEVFSLRSRVRGPYGISFHGGNYVLVGFNDKQEKIGLRVNMGYGFLRRIEWCKQGGLSWQPYLVNGYVELLIPSVLIDRMFPRQNLLR